MVVTIGLYLLAAIGSTGWFGDLVVLVSFGGTMGSVIGGNTGLVVKRRRHRRRVSPWNDPPPVEISDYMAVGASIGVALGAVVGAVDQLLF